MTSIAIDGPSGAGKSTLAQALAARTGFLYVDTGALYRAIGLAALRARVDPKDEAEVEKVLPVIDLALRHVDGKQRILLDGEDVSEAIREEKVGIAASDVSAHPSVRAFLLDTQRRLARETNVIMDGRDIGTVVLPRANVKIFLTATSEERARRRYEELLARGDKASYDKVLKDIEKRDYNDSHRAAAPLRRAEDAIEVVTTGFTFDQSLELLLSVIQERLPKEQDADGQ